MDFNNLRTTLFKLRSNRWFEIVVISVIIISALLLGAKTYDLSPQTISAIRIFDWLITVFFLLEITVRFLAEERKRDFFKNAWNVFDTVIVLVSLVPISGENNALLARLIRVFRVLRMVSIIPELRLLLNSLLKALPQLGYVILLMFIIFYIYGAIGANLFGSINETLWGDIAVAMLTLFRVMTFEDWTDVMYETMAVYPLSWFYYLSFIFFTAFAFLNMVIGIVVNVLDKESERLKKLEAKEHHEPTIASLHADIAEIKQMLKR